MAKRKATDESLLKTAADEAESGAVDTEAGAEAETTDDAEETAADEAEGGDSAGDGEGDSEGGDGEESGDDEEGSDEEEKIFVALYPILYHSHIYEVGDTLPTNDAEMMAAWIESGTAEWVGAGAKKKA